MYYQGQRVILKDKNNGFEKMGIKTKPFTGKLKYMNDKLITLDGTHGIIKNVYRSLGETLYNVFVLEANMHFELNEDCFEAYE